MSWQSDERTWTSWRTLALFGVSSSIACWLFTAMDCAGTTPSSNKGPSAPIDRETPLREEVDAVRALREDLAEP